MALAGELSPFCWESLPVQHALQMALWCFSLVLSVLLRGSQDRLQPIQLGEICRDTVCDRTDQSQHNWKAGAPAGGHTDDPKDCKKETSGWVPAARWRNLIQACKLKKGN